MGGDFITEDWESITSDNIRTLDSFQKNIRTLVLVGRTGNGKSATGNTILNRTVFESDDSMTSITRRCEMQTSVMEDGRTLNVIDTPGLYDSETERDFNQKEIIKCIDLAKDGIHAVLMVFSIQNRYSNEEDNAFKTLKFLFGEKIINYMILVFTRGDALKPGGHSFEKRISQSPKFQKVLDLCDNRVVLFDNETMDVSKRSEQRNKLLSLVELVVKKNGGQPFLDKSLAEVSRGVAILADRMKALESPMGGVKPESQSFWDDLNERFAVQTQQFNGILDSRVRETEENLKQLLEEEKKARLKVEEDAKAAKEEAEEKIRQLREQLENAEKARGGGCSIL